MGVFQCPDCSVCNDAGLAGNLLWNIANTFIFIYGVYKLPFSDAKKAIFGLLCLQEYITAALSLQFNVALTGLLLLSAVYIYERKEVKSVTAILIGIFVKIYGIVGFTQFFFIKNKTKFILSGIGIAILFFVLPMAYSSPQFVIQCYTDWFQSIVEKIMKIRSWKHAGYFTDGLCKKDSWGCIHFQSGIFSIRIAIVCFTLCKN
jgi:hypothetical protein